MKDRLLVLIVISIAALAVGRESAFAEAAPATLAETFTDIHGKRHAVLNPPKNAISVVVFITTDCPVANSYQPTLTRLSQQFSDQGVLFFLVHPSNRVSTEAALKHAEEFKIQSPVILDPEQVIARRLDAKVTPEAFVINEEGETAYRGRIDDLYAGFGKKRREPTRHDLRDAISQTLAGQPIASLKTDAIGCIITYAAKPGSIESPLP